MTTEKKFGCGAPAQRIVYRGRVKRLYSCAECAPEYKGSGRVHPYAVDTLGKKPPEGHHVGPAKNCGDATGDDE